MIRGLYSSATGMITQQDKINVLSNNLSNINTDGYKKDQVTLKTFDEELVTRMSDGVGIGTITQGSALDGVTTDLTQGSMEQTGLSTDLAISGNGFFAVQDAAGAVKYTRSGDFTVDSQGYMALSTGERVLGTNGAPLQVNGSTFAVASNGAVSVGGTQIGTIALADSQTAQVTKRRDGFFDIANPVRAGGILKQGYVEGSNVDAVNEMTGMMASTRVFQSCQEAFQVSGEALDKLITQVGSIKG